jgi:hypothetical protein
MKLRSEEALLQRIMDISPAWTRLDCIEIAIQVL